MGTTKTNQFTEDQNRKAELFKAIGHPARIAIIEFIIKQDSCVCGDIVNELPLALNNDIIEYISSVKKVEEQSLTFDDEKTVDIDAGFLATD